MKKLASLLVFAFILLTLSACTTTTVTCGEGTVIKDGKCVAADKVDDEEPNGVNVSCDSVTGDLVYEANYSNLVSNEPGDLHNANNFAIWGQSADGLLVDNASVSGDVLTIEDINGSQVDPYYESGLGYQFFNFESDVTYTVCTIVEGPTGQYLTSELGIYYGYGTKDDLLLTGEPQLIIQDFMPTITTNTDRGQYVLFIGNISGDVKIHQIKIVENK